MKNWLLLSLMVLFPCSFVNAASPVPLENPPVLFFSVPNKMELAKVESIVMEGVNRSNAVDNAWSVIDRKPGLLTARVVVRNKHTASLDIQYDAAKILISYKDSDNLDFEKISNKYEIIHPNYHKWVDALIANIKNSAQVATGSNPLTETPPGTEGTGSSGQNIVIAAYAEPGNADSGNALTRSKESYSKVVLELIRKNVYRTKPDNVAVVSIEDYTVTRDLIAEGRDHAVSTALCNQYKADKLLYINSPSNPGGRGSRPVTYYLHICENGRKFKEKYTIERTVYDTYGYQADYIYTLFDFMDYSKIYR